MSENVTPSEGILETCPFYDTMNTFVLQKETFTGRRGAGDLLRLSTVTNLTVSLPPPSLKVDSRRRGESNLSSKELLLK